ncbi:MAG: SocA family protein [Endomicrobium sp.]|jgi:uncharacterized phage-associated protein|nr:SocA family protein [Endomicrobium sp.]
MVSVRKILQALYYLQSKASQDNQAKYDVTYLLKLMFFADRYHIRHFGFIASGDDYFAMARGPVASAAYNVLLKQMPNKANSAERNLIEEVEEKSEFERVIKKQGDDELSKSFKKALDFAIKIYGKFNQSQLSDISHDYPEWNKHEEAIRNGAKRVPMMPIDFFENPQKIVFSNSAGITDDPFKEDEKFLKILKADFHETHSSF